MIYTSYFANLRNLPENIVPISICGKAPEWYKGLQYKKLAPKYDFFMEWKKNHDNNYYIEHFQTEVLDLLDADKVVDDLYSLILKSDIDTTGKDIALICYEVKPLKSMSFEDIIKSDKYFCHRHLGSIWLKQHGYCCEEYKNN